MPEQWTDYERERARQDAKDLMILGAGWGQKLYPHQAKGPLSDFEPTVEDIQTTWSQRVGDTQFKESPDWRQSSFGMDPGNAARAWEAAQGREIQPANWPQPAFGSWEKLDEQGKMAHAWQVVEKTMEEDEKFKNEVEYDFDQALRKRIPFAGAAAELAEQLDLGERARRITQGKGTVRDYLEIAKVMHNADYWENEANIGERAASNISSIATFGAEFYLTAGTGTLTRAVGKKLGTEVAKKLGLKALLKKYAGASVKKLFSPKTLKRSLVMGPTMAGSIYHGGRENVGQLEPTLDGGFQFAEEEDSALVDALEATGMAYAEIAIEELLPHGWVDKLTGGMKAKLTRGIGRLFSREAAEQTGKGLSRRAAFGGVIEELTEERMVEIANTIITRDTEELGVLGMGEGSGKQLMDEAIAMSALQVAHLIPGRGSQRAAERIQRDIPTEPLVTEQEQVAPLERQEVIPEEAALPEQQQAPPVEQAEEVPEVTIEQQIDNLAQENRSSRRDFENVVFPDGTTLQDKFQSKAEREEFLEQRRAYQARLDENAQAERDRQSARAAALPVAPVTEEVAPVEEAPVQESPVPPVAPIEAVEATEQPPVAPVPEQAQEAAPVSPEAQAIRDAEQLLEERELRLENTENPTTQQVGHVTRARNKLKKLQDATLRPPVAPAEQAAEGAEAPPIAPIEAQQEAPDIQEEEAAPAVDGSTYYAQEIFEAESAVREQEKTLSQIENPTKADVGPLMLARNKLEGLKARKAAIEAPPVEEAEFGDDPVSEENAVAVSQIDRVDVMRTFPGRKVTEDEDGNFDVQLVGGRWRVLVVDAIEKTNGQLTAIYNAYVGSPATRQWRRDGKGKWQTFEDVHPTVEDYIAGQERIIHRGRTRISTKAELEADATWDVLGTIEVARGKGTAQQIDALAHEAVHAAHLSGLWTDKEWAVLVEEYSKPGRTTAQQSEDIAKASQGLHIDKDKTAWEKPDFMERMVDWINRMLSKIGLAKLSPRAAQNMFFRSALFDRQADTSGVVGQMRADQAAARDEADPTTFAMAEGEVQMGNHMADEFEEKKHHLSSWSNQDVIDEMIELADDGQYDRALTKQIREYAVARGIYVPVTDKQLASITSFRGGRAGSKKADFKMGGVKYWHAETNADSIKSFAQETEPTDTPMAMAEGDISKIPLKEKLKDEYEYKREVFDEWTTEEVWEEIYELESEGEYNEDLPLQKQIRLHAIESGYYRPITDEELSRIWSTHPGKKYDFKMDGIKYTATDTPSPTDEAPMAAKEPWAMTRAEFNAARLTKQQMLARGSEGSLNNAVEIQMPISRIEGLEPVPAMEGGYVPGRSITQPVEIRYDKDLDQFTLYSGNHRVQQARVNGESTVPAFVEGITYEDLGKLSPEAAPKPTDDPTTFAMAESAEGEDAEPKKGDPKDLDWRGEAEKGPLDRVRRAVPTTGKRRRAYLDADRTADVKHITDKERKLEVSRRRSGTAEEVQRIDDEMIEKFLDPEYQPTIFDFDHARKIIDDLQLDDDPKKYELAIQLSIQYRDKKGDAARITASGRDPESGLKKVLTKLKEAIFMYDKKVLARIALAKKKDPVKRAAGERALEKEHKRIAAIRKYMEKLGYEWTDKGFRELTRNRKDMMRVIFKAVRSKKSRPVQVLNMVSEAVYMNVLSGFDTLFRNGMSNIWWGGGMELEELLSSLVNQTFKNNKDIIFSDYLNARRTRGDEPTERDVINVFKTAFSNAWVRWTQEYGPLEEMIGVAERQKFEMAPAIPGAGGRAMRMALGLGPMAATDQFAKTLFAHFDIGRIAQHMARVEALEYAEEHPGEPAITQDEIDARALELKSDTESKAWVAAMESALHKTFQDDGGPLSKKIIDLALKAKRLPGGGGFVMEQLLLLFVRTPVRFVGNVGARTPFLGTLMTSLPKMIKNRLEGRPIFHNVNRELISQLGVLLVFLLLMSDDEDPEEGYFGSTGARGSLGKDSRKFHYQAIPTQGQRIGKTWYKYDKSDPMAIEYAMLNDIVTSIKGGRGWKGTTADAGKSLLLSLQDKTFLRAMGDIAKSIESEDKGQRFYESSMTRLVPGLVSQTLRHFQDDITTVEADATTEGILRRMAITQGPKIYTSWGEPAKRNRPWLTPAWQPAEQVRGDRVFIEWNKKNVGNEKFPSQFERTYKVNGNPRKFELPDLAEFQRTAGTLAHKLVMEFVSESHAQNPDLMTVAVTKYLEEQARTEVKNYWKESGDWDVDQERMIRTIHKRLKKSSMLDRDSYRPSKKPKKTGDPNQILEDEIKRWEELGAGLSRYIDWYKNR